MLALAIISLSIFAIYLFAVLKYIGGVPQSLSETYYFLGNKYYDMYSDPSKMKFNHLRASTFTFMMWAVSFLLIAPMMEVTPDNGQFMVFIALASICFVGSAPQFKKKFEGKVHKVSAVVAAVFGILWAVLFADGIYMLAISAFICVIAAMTTKTINSSKTFRLEMVAFGTVYLSTIFALL